MEMDDIRSVKSWVGEDGVRQAVAEASRPRQVVCCMVRLAACGAWLVSCGVLANGVFCLREGCGLRKVVNWPSGLRRQFKALVRKGVGSNPTLANFFFLLPLACLFWRLYSLRRPLASSSEPTRPTGSPILLSNDSFRVGSNPPWA